MKLKLSATFEGKCTICGKEKVVFTAGDEDTKRAVTICKDCADQLGGMKLSDAIEKYGKTDEESFKGGVSIQSTNKCS